MYQVCFVAPVFLVMQVTNAFDAAMALSLCVFSVCVCISFVCHLRLLHFESSRSISSIDCTLKYILPTLSFENTFQKIGPRSSTCPCLL